MRQKIFAIILVLFVAYSENSIIRFPAMPNLDLFLDRIANTTIDVVNGVTGVVNGGVGIVTNTILRIINGAGTVTEKLINLLEEFRKRMVMGIPELGIPILEPLTVEFIDLNITHEVGRFVGYARDIEVRHLSRFKIDHISLNLQNRLSFNITFPYLKVIGFYEINGNVGDMFRIYGKGPFWLKLQGLSISVVTQLRFSTKHNPYYYLEWMKIKVKLQKIQNNFENLMSDKKTGDVYNKAVSQVGPEALDMLWPDVEPRISKQIVQIINQKLRDFRLGNIIGSVLNILKINSEPINVHTYLRS